MVTPTPGPGQTLVRVRASTVNPLDVKLRSGSLRRKLPLTFPTVLGFDFAGVIDSLGTGVTGWSVGERVYGRVDAKTGQRTRSLWL
jgi:NADPH:quinone reductase-like Zn-dependent oxidoreductase